MIVTRFAPSPTGRLHLGHAFAALYAWRRAREAGGRFLLRIEDIDEGRCREEFVAAILEDLAWLGLDWDGEVRRQSRHLADYRAALGRLEAAGLLYPCFCTRADIARALDAPQGPEGPVYPGACRALSAAERAARIAAGSAYALRLDVAKALAQTGPLAWTDEAAGTIAADPTAQGDVVLARKDAPTSYHLAVTADDAAQGVSLVTRGADLFAATHIHRLLQALLGLPTPLYRHHPLVTDPGGRRLAKRDRALTLAALRQSGRTAADVRAMAESAAT
jgi:glutamyl-Q tRNA(Asp) synthetase